MIAIDGLSSTPQASGMRVVFDDDGNSRDPLELLALSGRLGGGSASEGDRGLLSSIPTDGEDARCVEGFK